VTYKRIRSLTRGLEVLRYLNTVTGAHPVDVCRKLALPRPTVHRILETLQELHLVYQGQYSNEFRVTPQVRGLSGSTHQFHALREAAWPVMKELTAEVIWPSDLAIHQAGAMVIVESTHRLSPMSIDIGMVGRTRSMLSSPLGRAFISHCSAERQREILAECDEENGIYDPEFTERMMARCREEGLSVCLDLPHDRCASVAAPVHHRGEVVASLNVVWRITELDFDEALATLKQPLFAARDRIEARLRAAQALEDDEQGQDPRVAAHPLSVHQANQRVVGHVLPC